MSAMRKFYWDNVKYSLKLLFYKLKLYGTLIVPLAVLMVLGIFLSSKISPDLSNIVVISAIISVLLLGLLILWRFFWRFLYISGYSFLKNEEGSKERLKFFFSNRKVFTNWRVFLTLSLGLVFILLLGSLVYYYALSELAALDLVALKQGVIVGIKIILTALIVTFIGGVLFLIFLFLKNLSFIAALLRGFLGILLKVAAAAVILFVLYNVSMLIYLRLSSFLDPILYPLLGIYL